MARTAEIKRRTNETDITLRLSLDGGASDISTGIGFLIGRYKKAQKLHIPLYVQSPNLAADKILNISGIYKLIPKAE